MRTERTRIRGARTAGWSRSVVDIDLTRRGKWGKWTEEIRSEAEFVRQEGVEGRTHKGTREQRDSTQTAREESRKKKPAERDEDSRRAGLLWPLAGTPMLYKVALWHPRTQLSSPSFFHPVLDWVCRISKEIPLSQSTLHLQDVFLWENRIW